MANYRIVEATRTTLEGTKTGWAVERCDARMFHVASILCETKEQAFAEYARLSLPPERLG